MGCLLWWWLRPEAKRISFISIWLPPRVRTTTWSPRLLPSSNIQERTFVKKGTLATELRQPCQVSSCTCSCTPSREVDTYCLCDGEHFPASRVDWNESRGQQLLLLCVVASAGVKQLINTNLNETGEMRAYSDVQSRGIAAFHLIDRLLVFNGTYLAEMVPVECQCCLRSQLEKMELCGENLLSSGNRGQVEPVLHLFAAHCNGNCIIREQNSAAKFHFLQ